MSFLNKQRSISHKAEKLKKKPAESCMARGEDNGEELVVPTGVRRRDISLLCVSVLACFTYAPT